MIRQPDWAWQIVGRSKAKWITALVLGIFVGGTYWVAAAYVLAVRSKLHRSKEDAVQEAAAHHQLIPGFHRSDDEPSFTDALVRLDAKVKDMRERGGGEAGVEP